MKTIFNKIILMIFILSIPNLREGINKAESLNVANSTAIFLSELFR